MVFVARPGLDKLGPLGVRIVGAEEFLAGLAT